jgi:hypothetical protein
MTQELEKRYYSGGGGTPSGGGGSAEAAGAAGRALGADLALLRSFLGDRGWASIELPGGDAGGGHGRVSTDVLQSIEGQLDEVRAQWAFCRLMP